MKNFESKTKSKYNITPETLIIVEAISSKCLQMNPFFIKITGSVVSGYLLTQLYWLSKEYRHDEFYKNDAHFFNKLMLTEWELRAHKKKLKDLGLINIRYGKDKKPFYTVNILKICDLAVDNSDFVNEDSSVPKTRIPRHVNEESSGTYIRKKNSQILPIKNSVICAKSAGKNERANNVVDINSIERHIEQMKQRNSIPEGIAKRCTKELAQEVVFHSKQKNDKYTPRQLAKGALKLIQMGTWTTPRPMVQSMERSYEEKKTQQYIEDKNNPIVRRLLNVLPTIKK